MPSLLHRRGLPYLLLVAMVTLTFANSIAQLPEDSLKQENISQQINAFLKEGDFSQALPLIRQYDAQYPGNASVLYNLACAETSQGNTGAAINALERAILAGFSNFHQVQNDPDLQTLMGEPGFQALVMEQDITMTAQATNRSFTIGEKTWSPYQHFSSSTDSGIKMRARWQALGLAIEVSGPILPDSNPDQANSAPWAGGNAVHFTLAIVDEKSSWESDNAFHFVFGRNQGFPVGAMYLPSQNQWQQVEELSPKMSKSGEGFFYSFTLPWKILEPFHPLVDPTLGVNVSVRQATESGLIIQSLVKDPAAFQPDSAWYRFIPLTFDSSNIEKALLKGRLSHSISSNNPMTLDLRIISPLSGPGTLKIDFLDRENFSVLDETKMDMPLSLNQGSNSFSWPVDFSSLRTGPYLVRAAVQLPNGESLVWETPVLHLQPGWIETVSKFFDNVPAKEKATVTLIQNSLTEAIPQLKRCRNPQAIGTTLHDFLAMADQARLNGSILPDEGSFVLAYPGIKGEQRLCSVYFPSGYQDAPQRLPLLVMTNYRGYEVRMADRMGKFYQFWSNAPKPEQRLTDRAPIYIFPHLDAAVSGLNQDGAEEAAHCALWATNFFRTQEVAAVGVDACLGDALSLASNSSIPLTRMLLIAGSDVQVWPQAQPEFLLQKLPAPAGNLPVTWLDFPFETATHGQATDILSALQKNKWNITQSKDVKGALGITQVTDRIILWAENQR